MTREEVLSLFEKVNGVLGQAATFAEQTKCKLKELENRIEELETQNRKNFTDLGRFPA